MGSFILLEKKGHGTILFGHGDIRAKEPIQFPLMVKTSDDCYEEEAGNCLRVCGVWGWVYVAQKLFFISSGYSVNGFQAIHFQKVFHVYTFLFEVF